MAQITCKNCGQLIYDDAASCPYCGAATNGYGKLTFEWEGSWAVNDARMYITLNGENIGTEESYSFANGFSVQTPITSDEANITLVMPIDIPTGLFNFKYKNKDNFVCSLEKGKNYTCKISYSRMSGRFTYEISDDNGNITYKKGLSKGWILFCTLTAIMLIAIFILLILFGDSRVYWRLGGIILGIICWGVGMIFRKIKDKRK